ncbi:Integrase, catalytic region [Cardinium endosymbiont cEper1 of Encarsia pergandiella]|nr:Integrase, catalytic region [Cardinium endosymbiont cEper1 of Encarsia pergandiella]
MYVAIDRVSKFAYAELHTKQTKMLAVEFLGNLIQSVPYRIHKILTDNGIQFTHYQQHRHAFPNIFDRVCKAHAIEHRKTKVKHLWTKGQVERMNRTLKEATVHNFMYANHNSIKNSFTCLLDGLQFC